MKKILKRLCMGVLTLATVFTTLATSQVHASEKQYWTDAQEKAGYVEKVMNDGSIGSMFYGSIMQVRAKRLTVSTSTLISSLDIRPVLTQAHA